MKALSYKARLLTSAATTFSYYYLLIYNQDEDVVYEGLMKRADGDNNSCYPFITFLPQGEGVAYRGRMLVELQTSLVGEDDKEKPLVMDLPNQEIIRFQAMLNACSVYLKIIMS